MRKWMQMWLVANVPIKKWNICYIMFPRKNESYYLIIAAENGGCPPTQNGDSRSLFRLFSLMALQN